MIDESNTQDEISWYYHSRSETAVRNLRKRQIGAKYVRNRSEALSTVMSMIPDGATVVRGDSITLEQVGIVGALKKLHEEKHIVFIDPLSRDANGEFLENHEARFEQQRKAFLADVFLTGLNAITLDGKIVNIDAYGNRVAPLIFGPKKVVAIAGANKIVLDLAEAINRIHSTSAPMNVRRHYLKHKWPELEGLPCLSNGSCVQCLKEWRICLITVIIEGVLPWSKDRIHVIIVGEHLGL